MNVSGIHSASSVSDRLTFSGFSTSNHRLFQATGHGLTQSANCTKSGSSLIKATTFLKKSMIDLLTSQNVQESWRTCFFVTNLQVTFIYVAQTLLNLSYFHNWSWNKSFTARTYYTEPFEDWYKLYWRNKIEITDTSQKTISSCV